ncbi:MAG: carbohydrate ABC transporter permease [Clostridiales bacterium]|nr:carbohydrate ABC transporter permease [Clostridiales bacterium]
MGRNALYNSPADRALDAIVYAASVLLIAVTLYPLIYVVAISFSSRLPLEQGRVYLWPIDFTWAAYLKVFTHPLLARSYGNTLIYAIGGTAYSMVLTILGAYGCAKRGMPGRNFFTFFITFTMLFSGGLIPTFLTVNRLGLFNTMWALLLPCAVSPWNMIVIRTAMLGVPASLEESAVIDGANDLSVLWHIHYPLSLASIATIALFYLVGRWNDYFSALIYLNNSSLFPVQLVIRGLLVSMTDTITFANAQTSNEALAFSPLAFKGAVVVITTLPIMCVYPFLQRYFVKGMMIGAIKG